MIVIKRFARPSQWLHWLTALLFIAIFSVTIYMDKLPISPQKFEVYNVHKSLGFVIMVMAILRLVIRFFYPAPPPLSTMAPVNILLAKLGHLGLYGLMIIQPMIGIVHSWAANNPIIIFNQFSLPSLIAANPQIVGNLGQAHKVLGFLFFAMVIGHIVMSLIHNFILKDKLFIRMNPFK